MSPEISTLLFMVWNPRDMWAKFHPAVPSENVRRVRKRRPLLFKGVLLAGFVLLVAWLTNAGMNLLLGTKQIEVETSHVQGVRARMSQSTNTLTEGTVDGCVSVAAPALTQEEMIEDDMGVVQTNSAWLHHYYSFRSMPTSLCSTHSRNFPRTIRFTGRKT